MHNIIIRIRNFTSLFGEIHLNYNNGCFIRRVRPNQIPFGLTRRTNSSTHTPASSHMHTCIYIYVYVRVYQQNWFSWLLPFPSYSRPSPGKTHPSYHIKLDDSLPRLPMWCAVSVKLGRTEARLRGGSLKSNERSGEKEREHRTTSAHGITCCVVFRII